MLNTFWDIFCHESFVSICREHKRKTFDSIVNFGWWQAVVLLFVGFLGGIFSAIAGSGVDICSFSVLSLLFRQAASVFTQSSIQAMMFRISEKVSTPTSVVLMAINTMFGENISEFLNIDIDTFRKLCLDFPSE